EGQARAARVASASGARTDGRDESAAVVVALRAEDDPRLASRAADSGPAPAPPPQAEVAVALVTHDVVRAGTAALPVDVGLVLPVSAAHAVGRRWYQLVGVAV